MIHPGPGRAAVRTVLTDQNGRLWICAAVVGRDHEVRVAATLDGIRPADRGADLFVPLDWARRRYPEHSARLESIGADGWHLDPHRLQRVALRLQDALPTGRAAARALLRRLLADADLDPDLVDFLIASGGATHELPPLWEPRGQRLVPLRDIRVARAAAALHGAITGDSPTGWAARSSGRARRRPWGAAGAPQRARPPNRKTQTATSTNTS